MSTSQGFRWRTVVEVGLISAVIYVLLGAPGFPAGLVTGGSSTAKNDVPVARAKIESLVYPDQTLSCAEHEYNIHVFSTAPLVIYIDGFLSEGEAEHLVNIRSVSLHFQGPRTPLTQHPARTNGRYRPSSTKVSRQPTLPSASPRRRSLTVTTSFNALSNVL